MAAYVITQRMQAVRDKEAMARYPVLAKPIIERFGGKFLVASDQVKLIEGDGPAPVRTTIIEFPSAEHAMGWYNSPEYKEAAKIRHANTRSHMILVTTDGPVVLK